MFHSLKFVQEDVTKSYYFRGGVDSITLQGNFLSRHTLFRVDYISGASI